MAKPQYRLTDAERLWMAGWNAHRLFGNEYDFSDKVVQERLARDLFLLCVTPTSGASPDGE